MRTFPLLIDGEDVDTGRYEYFPYADPSILDPSSARQAVREAKHGRFSSDTEKYIYARYCVGTNDTNQQALTAAHKASKIFRHFTPSRRHRIMKEIYRQLMAQKNALIDLMVVEGHPRKLAEWEFSGMEAVCREETISFYTSELVKRMGTSGREARYCVRKADGVVCISPPKNAACSNSTLGAHALLGGNTIIIKPPLHAPLSTMWLWKQVIHKAAQTHGAPPGTINIILGNSKVITDEWLASPHVNDLLFFGDSEQGLEIGLQAFRAGKKPILELSGNDMLLVWKDAPLNGAIESLLDGFLGSTQICMVPKKALIHEAIYEEFEQRFTEAAKQLTVGLPSTAHTCLTPVLKIAEFYATLEDARQKGAVLLCGGEQVDYRGTPDKRGVFITPAVLRVPSAEMARSMRCIQEENFFPLIPLVRVSAMGGRGAKQDRAIFSEMVDMANANLYGLRLSVWIRSRPYMYQFIKQIQTGGLLRINARHVGFSAQLSSHGGTGRSGGPYGEMNYVWQKTTHLQGITVATPS